MRNRSELELFQALDPEMVNRLDLDWVTALVKRMIPCRFQQWKA